jgi:sporulation protein YlmC with PRC-barrel domain
MSERIDIAVGVLDHQLLDSERRRCGKVDDLELEGVQEGAPAVAAILVGSPAWRGRGLIGRLAARLGRGRQVRIEWSEVRTVESAVVLKRSAHELSLDRGELRAQRLIEWIPGSRL